jgi:hypothetical protein
VQGDHGVHFTRFGNRELLTRSKRHFKNDVCRAAACRATMSAREFDIVSEYAKVLTTENETTCANQYRVATALARGWLTTRPR